MFRNYRGFKWFPKKECMRQQTRNTSNVLYKASKFKRGKKSVTGFPVPSKWSQLEAFTESLVIDGCLSTKFSSATGSHRLFVRLRKEELGTELCRLLKNNTIFKYLGVFQGRGKKKTNQIAGSCPPLSCVNQTLGFVFTKSNVYSAIQA